MISLQKGNFPRRDDYPDNLEVLNTKSSKQYYNAVEASASAYFDSPRLVKYLFFKRLTKIISLLNDKYYFKTLDAGTGLGILLPVLSQKSKEVLATDYSNIIEYASFMCKRRGIKNISFQKVDLNQLSLQDKFDLILCLSVLEHIEEPGRVLKKFNELLRPGGILIVGYPIETSMVKLTRYFESYFRKSVDSKIRNHGYEKTEEFTGHISDWKKIDQALIDNFDVDKKIDLSFCLLKYYAIRKAVKKNETKE